MRRKMTLVLEDGGDGDEYDGPDNSRTWYLLIGVVVEMFAWIVI